MCIRDRALTDLGNRRQDNAKALSAFLGGGMFKTLVSELGADMDGDGLPDMAERPSNRGKANDVQYMAEAHGNGSGPGGDTRPTQRPR